LDGKDPMCKTGLMEASSEATRVCCPKFCSECTSYVSCSAAFEHDTDKSKNSCCVDTVTENSCDNAGANGLTATSTPPCVKKCSESLPPCLMEDVDFTFDPDQVSAADDCGNAVSEWEATAKGIIEGLGLVQGNNVTTNGTTTTTAALSRTKCVRAKTDKKCVCELKRGNETIGVVREK